MSPLLTNPDLLAAIQMVHESKDKDEALKKAFSLIIEKYHGHRFFTYLFFWRALETNPNIPWQRSGFLHCTQQNSLLRLLLIESGWFGQDEISMGYSLVWYISPHQYLRVKCHTQTLALDPWNNAFGAPFGTYAVGFGHRS